jgi:hypothetical protein
MIEKLLRWLGYVPVSQLAEAWHDARMHEAAAIRLDMHVQGLDSEITALRFELVDRDEALAKANKLLNARLAKLAERLSPVVSLHRRPDEVSRYRFDLDIECDLLEKMVVDYRIKGSSADYELLMAGLARRVRDSLDKLLKIG